MDEDRPQLYIAVLVFSTHVEGGYQRPRLSEDIVPIFAASEDDAGILARRIGCEGQARYSNEYGEMVHWSFIGLADLRPALTEALESGESLYSRSFIDLDRYKELYSVESFDDETNK